MAKTITSTTNETKSDRDPALRGTVGVVAAAAGALAVSEDELAIVAGVAASAAASAAVWRTVSEDGLTVAAGAAAPAAFVAESLRAWDDGRVG